MDWKSTTAQNAAFQLPGASSRADSRECDALYGGVGARHAHPDPHVVCLKLGKRHYFEDHVAAAVAAAASGGPMAERHVADKRGKGCSGVTSAVARCQVEGCHVALVNAKDYHRRHKVCEMHSKAPRVVVLGLEQRFCQQCSRFHVVSEFEETKRSCKRRLAGHNERRRKSSHDSITRTSSFNGGFPYMVSSPSTSTGTARALSLLSSNTDTSFEWVPPNSPDLSSRSSAALRELIAENRARQLSIECKSDSWQTQHQIATDDFSAANPQEMFAQPQQCWDTGAHVTLDLLQRPSAPFGFVPAGARARAKAEGEEGCDLWNSFWKDI